ncbi:MAG: PTS fructose transporter subunit IIA [Bacillota bacterium]|nr:PTS fructose transporter subunit IIA [Bacillota bacterium]
MKYVVLVSHGQLASGFYSALSMIAGKGRKDVLFQGLADGMSAERFGINFAAMIENIKAEDEIILFADIIGGSPLTTALNLLESKGLLQKTYVVGGMNLPMILEGVLMKDSMDMEEFKETLLRESKEAIKEFKLLDTEQEEDI